MWKRRYERLKNAIDKLTGFYLYQWLPEVMALSPRVPIILVACKKDLRNDPRSIDALRRQGQSIVTPEQVCPCSTHTFQVLRFNAPYTLHYFLSYCPSPSNSLADLLAGSGGCGEDWGAFVL